MEMDRWNKESATCSQLPKATHNSHLSISSKASKWITPTSCPPNQIDHPHHPKNIQIISLVQVISIKSPVINKLLKSRKYQNLKIVKVKRQSTLFKIERSLQQNFLRLLQFSRYLNTHTSKERAARKSHNHRRTGVILTLSKVRNSNIKARALTRNTHHLRQNNSFNSKRARAMRVKSRIER